jgi:hypothetical protein
VRTTLEHNAQELSRINFDATVETVIEAMRKFSHLTSIEWNQGEVEFIELSTSIDISTGDNGARG